jgi:hypothetical protein
MWKPADQVMALFEQQRKKAVEISSVTGFHDSAKALQHAC